MVSMTKCETNYNFMIIFSLNSLFIINIAVAALVYFQKNRIFLTLQCKARNLLWEMHLRENLFRGFKCYLRKISGKGNL